MNGNRLFLGLLLAAALSACGGGGGGGGGGSSVIGGTGATPTPPATPSGEWLTLTPSSVSLTAYQGEETSFTINAKSSRTFTQSFNIGIVDGKGVITPDVKLFGRSELEYDATLKTSATLAPGTYTTNLEVRLCEDQPQTCAKPFPGSPWHVPVTVTVKPSTSLGQLNAIAGLSPWSMYQGNASHTGFVPATFTTANFNRRWSVTADRVRASSAVIADGKAFLAWKNNAPDSAGSAQIWSLVAIDENNGQTAWSADLGRLGSISSPAAANGKVYITTESEDGTEAYLWVFDQATGKILNKTTTSPLLITAYAPTLYGDSVFNASYSYGRGGLNKFSEAGAKFEWLATLPECYFYGCAPAVDATYSYVYVKGVLYAIKNTDGTNAFTITVPELSNPLRGAAILGNQMAYAADYGILIGFDLAKRSVAWSIKNGTLGQPTLANDTIYSVVANGTMLEARTASNGLLQWTIKLSDAQQLDMSNIVATNSHLFVSFADKTVAIDIGTHAVVWTYPMSGALAISNRGVLFISNSTGKIAAINLQ